uniref:Transmembrane 9 superfamily member n=1 Tax=Rhizophora mucronata TaxID=61149 RepID=A0A2P2MKB3_RHIMU
MAYWAVAVLVLCVVVGQVRSDASDHRFKAGEDVPLYANKVGPFHNPSETYRYFDLPFCSSGLNQFTSSLI